MKISCGISAQYTKTWYLLPGKRLLAVGNPNQLALGPFLHRKLVYAAGAGDGHSIVHTLWQRANRRKNGIFFLSTARRASSFLCLRVFVSVPRVLLCVCVCVLAKKISTTKAKRKRTRTHLVTRIKLFDPNRFDSIRNQKSEFK